MWSPLQKYIMQACINKKGRVTRQLFASFYATNNKVKKILQTKIITKSLERLIQRGLLKGYGVRTSEKWFIKDVVLTPLGRHAWSNWLQSRQTRLPLK